MIPLPIAPVLEFVASYWKLFAVGGLVVAAYVTGCTQEKEKFDDWKATQAAIAKQQERWTAGRIKQQKQDTEKADQDYQKALADLRRDSSAVATERVRDTASRRFVPSVSGAAPGRSTTDLTCFKADELESGIQRSVANLLGRITGLLQKGDEANTAFAACGTWVLEQWKADKAARPTSP